MEESETIEIKTRELDRLVIAFKNKIPTARVGILGKKAERPRKMGQSTNAEIGMKHEFGDGKLPIRSFLRVPISEHLQQFLENAGAFDQDSLKQVIKEGNITAWIKKIAGIAENVVAEAFASGGFGKWKPSDMRHKKVQLTLVETQQLRNSISSEVK